MIDIHCHILPGIDDGPEDLEESVELARMAVEEGIYACAATPHFYVGLYTPDQATIREKVLQLNAALEARNIAFRVFPGMEVALTPEVIAHFDDGELLGLNHTSTFLVEPSRHSTPDTIHKACHHLLLRGAIPILAHPERNLLLQRDPSFLLDLVRSGLLLQINATSLDPLQPRKVWDCARYLLEHRAVHCIATDAHSVDHRPPRLREAVEMAERLLGSREEALALVTRIPGRLLAGKEYTAPEPVAPEPLEPVWKRLLPFRHRTRTE